MPDLNIKFDRHGLGDCVHFAHALQLYKSRGFNVTVQAEENKLFVWKVAGVNIVQGGGLPDHPYIYPAGFDDLAAPDHERNKVAFGLRHDVMPRLEAIGLSQEQAWDELCAVRLSAHEHIPAEAHAEAEQFLEGLPRPIICFHSRGTNWHERKSLPTDVAFDVILKLLEQTGGSVIVLDFDHRAPMVGHERCKGLKPSWGHIGIDRLCALYERCDLMVGVDSGPLHVASFTNIKTLGVFRSLHPTRVCLPNQNAVYLVSDRHADQWNERRERWNLATYQGPEPTADDVVDAALSMLNSSQHLSRIQHAEMISRCSGIYLYKRVGFDERRLQLLPGGRIGEGRAGCEQFWKVHVDGDVDVIEIHGKDGTICRCRHERDGAYRGRWLKFEKMPIELQLLHKHSADSRHNLVIPPLTVTQIPSISSLHTPYAAGQYTYRRLGFDQRPMELRNDGTIGIGAGKAEQRWELKIIEARPVLELSGESDVIATCIEDFDGVWRGRWNQYERMPIELVPANRKVSDVRPVTHIPCPRNQFTYHTTNTLINGAVSLARKLPTVRAVVGIPRSGLLPAATISLELNVPLIEMSALRRDHALIPTELRRRADIPKDGIILIVDDTAASGQQLHSLRDRFPYAKTAAVFCDPRATDVVDYWEFPHPQTYQAYEWNILHDDNNEFIMTDLDGVLCEDWTGGDEENCPDRYADFLANAAPRRIPTTSTWKLMAIVTGRLEQHRAATEKWLSRHGIQYSQLIMSPYPTAAERDRAADVALRKAEEYSKRPDARLFIESCSVQARAIKFHTNRPVLSIADNALI